MTEDEVRALRDRVFGRHPEKEHSDKNWDACKQNWMRPDSIAWLKAMAGKDEHNPD